jgi:hypothetical protein
MTIDEDAVMTREKAGGSGLHRSLSRGPANERERERSESRHTRRCRDDLTTSEGHRQHELLSDDGAAASALHTESRSSSAPPSPTRASSALLEQPGHG